MLHFSDPYDRCPSRMHKFTVSVKVYMSLSYNKNYKRKKTIMNKQGSGNKLFFGGIFKKIYYIFTIPTGNTNNLSCW